MVRMSMAFDNGIKVRKEKLGLTWERIFFIGLEEAERIQAEQEAAASAGQTPEC